MVLSLCCISALVALHSLACPVQASAKGKKVKPTAASTKAMKAMFTICPPLYICTCVMLGE